MSSEDQVEYDRYLTLARQQLEDVEFQSAWSRGSTMIPEQIVDELGNWFEDLNIIVHEQARSNWPTFDERTLGIKEVN